MKICRHQKPPRNRTRYQQFFLPTRAATWSGFRKKMEAEGGNRMAKAHRSFLLSVAPVSPNNEDMTPEERLARLNEARDQEDPWLEWYRLTPQERWEESKKIWQFYLQVGGSLDPQSDSQSPFDAYLPQGQAPAYGRAGVRVLRRGRV